jgi:hypothetical protein
VIVENPGKKKNESSVQGDAVKEGGGIYCTIGKEEPCSEVAERVA